MYGMVRRPIFPPTERFYLLFFSSSIRTQTDRKEERQKKYSVIRYYGRERGSKIGKRAHNTPVSNHEIRTSYIRLLSEEHRRSNRKYIYGIFIGPKGLGLFLNMAQTTQDIQPINSFSIISPSNTYFL